MRRKTLYIILVLTILTFGGSLCYENRDSSWWPWVGHDEWTMTGYDLQGSFSSPNWGPNPVEKNAWTKRINSRPAGSPLLQGDHLIVSSVDGTVRALNRWTGSVKWTYTADEEIGFPGTPAFLDRSVYSVMDDQVVALDTNNGKEEWSVDLNEEVNGRKASIVPGDGRVYVTGQDSVVAYDADNGDTLWRHQKIVQGRAHYHRSPSRAGEKLFLTVNNQTSPGSHGFTGEQLPTQHKVVGLDSMDGDTILSVQVPLAEGSVSQPVYEGDTVYLRAHSNIVAVDPQADTIAWTWEVDSSLSNNISVEGDRLYTVTHDGTVYALDLTDRETVWKTELDGVIDAAPNVGGEGLYLTVESDVVRLDRGSGSVTSRYSVGDRLNGAPVPANNHLYTLSPSGTLYALSN